MAYNVTVGEPTLPTAPATAVGPVISGSQFQFVESPTLVEFGDASDPFETLRQQRIASLDRKTYHFGESVLATMQTWIPSRVIDLMQAPVYPAQEGYSSSSSLSKLTFMVDEGERSWLGKSKSSEEFEYKAFQLEQKRHLATVMGDNPGVSLLTAMADPTYLLLAGALVVATIITKLKRSKRIVLMKLHESANMSENVASPKTTTAEHMICCDQCDIYIPDSEAFSRGGRVFCSIEHSIQFFSSRD